MSASKNFDAWKAGIQRAEMWKRLTVDQRAEAMVISANSFYLDKLQKEFEAGHMAEGVVAAKERAEVPWYEKGRIVK